MIIYTFEHLNALNKLLGAVKFSEDLNSEELELFAGSPLINDIYRQVREEFLIQLRAKGYGKEADKWLEDTKFRFDSPQGQAIRKRILNWPSHVLGTVREFDRQKIVELARQYIEPVAFEATEIDRLADFIVERIK